MIGFGHIMPDPGDRFYAEENEDTGEWSVIDRDTGESFPMSSETDAVETADHWNETDRVG